MNITIVHVIDSECPSGGHVINSPIMEQVKLACDSLQANSYCIKYDELDHDDKKSADTFYNSDVAVIDLSIEEHRNNLFYHLGVRESFGQKQNILLLKVGLEDTINKISNLAIEQTSTGHGKIVKFPGLDYPTLLYTEEEATDDNFAMEMRRLLMNAETQCKANIKDKVLTELIRAREALYDEDTSHVFYSIKDRLKDTTIISEAVILNLLLAFRDIQDFRSIVEIVENSINIESISKSSSELPGIMHIYAFALIRCNGIGHREKAIEVISRAVEMPIDSKTSSNLYCLLGRIYKDKFIESDYTDRDSLQDSIKWYGEGFQSQPNEYAGINLATLLIVSGEVFSKSEQLTNIGMTINNLLGRKGNLASVRDYWTVATFFEVNILTENYSKAIQTAELMFKLKPRQWYLRSTMRNLKLIMDYRKKSKKESLKDQETMFQFWIEYFLDACKGDITEVQDIKIPVLLSESRREYTPCYLMLSSQRKTVQISNNSLHDRNDPKKKLTQQNWIFSKDKIKSLNLLQRDNRGVFLRLRKNSDDFHLFFPNSEYRELFYNTVVDHNF